MDSRNKVISSPSHRSLARRAQFSYRQELEFGKSSISAEKTNAFECCKYHKRKPLLYKFTVSYRMEFRGIYYGKNFCVLYHSWLTSFQTVPATKTLEFTTRDESFNGEHNVRYRITGIQQVGGRTALWQEEVGNWRHGSETFLIGHPVITYIQTASRLNNQPRCV